MDMDGSRPVVKPITNYLQFANITGAAIGELELMNKERASMVWKETSAQPSVIRGRDLMV